MTESVLVVGSANQDIVVRVSRIPALGETVLGEGLSLIAGGKGLNQAYACASTGVNTTFLGAVGSDDYGDALLASLAGGGVDTANVLVLDDQSSGTAHILVSAIGGNQIVVVPGANAAVTAEYVEMHLRSHPNPRVMVLQGEIPVETNLAAARLADELGIRTVFNLAPAADVPQQLLDYADPLVVNEFEAGLVLHATAPTNQAEAATAAKALATQSRSVIITLGEQGSVLCYDGRVIPIDPVIVKDEDVVDTTGAGDAFVGVLAAELADGLSLEAAARKATEAAALTVTQPGASTSYHVIRGFYG